MVRGECSLRPGRGLPLPLCRSDQYGLRAPGETGEGDPLRIWCPQDRHHADSHCLRPDASH